MARQFFKSIYFADFSDSNRRNLKIAFGERDVELYKVAQAHSSYELRGILGHGSFRELRGAAEREDLPLNTYCVRVIRRWFEAGQNDAGQLMFPELENSRVNGTFRGSKELPLQRWYPFLEGYSPRFVEQILLRFAPQAKRILDPFAGVGTTPLTAARLGRQALFCEVNPLLQFLTEAKLHALLLPIRERRRIVEALGDLAARLLAEVGAAWPDTSLRESYGATFGSSKFFPADVFEDILRTRAFLDRLAGGDPSLAEFATVAALASLIPASNLRRAGDLRFRRGREFDHMQSFLPLMTAQLRIVAEDLDAAPPVIVPPILLAADAKRLGDLPLLQIDAVVTSPPYLNGTNYFRNTKVELWFLRSVRTSDDLAAFRRLAVTAGINDVTRSKAISSDPDVLRLVEALDRTAYDPRIPRMVGSYFQDLELCLSAIRPHLVSGAVVAIDIGDSIYAGVHVPTDRVLVSIAQRLGLALERSVPLRTRVSRDQSPLKQVLLVFRVESAGPTTPRTTLTARLRRQWQIFKENLPHQTQPFAKRNWGHPFHSLCSYQGKMKPSLAHHLVRTFVPEGGRLLDPFAGVGTIPFEAALQGIMAFAFEISPAALAISRAKLGKCHGDEVECTLRSLAEFIASEKPSRRAEVSVREIRFNGALEDYFHARTLKEILLAREFFRQNPPRAAGQCLVMASLLHILHGNRPYALSRRSHPITPFAPTGPAEYRSLMTHVRQKVGRAIAAEVPERFREGKTFDCDATLWWPQEVDQLDAVITSPPFFDSTRFHLANWMRLWFSGWEKSDFEGRPRSFVDERQKMSFRVYEPIFRQSRERLKQGGVLVLHLGYSRKCDMGSALASVAKPWFRVVDQFSENVSHCESHGIRDKGTVTAHQLLVLQ